MKVNIIQAENPLEQRRSAWVPRKVHFLASRTFFWKEFGLAKWREIL